jgi:integrase
MALRAGLPDFTTHTFRHLRLTDLARSGLELHEIATYAGHRSLNTTLKYIHLGSQELGEHVRRATRSLEARNKALFERQQNARMKTEIDSRAEAETV